MLLTIQVNAKEQFVMIQKKLKRITLKIQSSKDTSGNLL